MLREILGEIEWVVLGYPRGFTKTPLLFGPHRFDQPTDSIAFTYPPPLSGQQRWLMRIPSILSTRIITCGTTVPLLRAGHNC